MTDIDRKLTSPTSANAGSVNDTPSSSGWQGRLGDGIGPE